MSLKKYLLFMTSATLISWIAWLVVLFYINPVESGVIGFVFFYVSMFFALIGTFSLIGFFGRVWFTKEPIIFRHLGISTRQSLWFAILIVGTLLLQSADLYRWWSISLLIIFLTLLEFFFLSRKVVSR
ncbi:hypothetical protein IID19_04830 [Patescibacteria group bacterium]|nr:hypothetical protein [Patescibacteria group bacterium]